MFFFYYIAHLPRKESFTAPLLFFSCHVNGIMTNFHLIENIHYDVTVLSVWPYFKRILITKSPIVKCILSGELVKYFWLNSVIFFNILKGFSPNRDVRLEPYYWCWHWHEYSWRIENLVFCRGVEISPDLLFQNCKRCTSSSHERQKTFAFY